jgi:hypothetical protein
MRGERRLAYASLWLFALAFGWIEATVVVYLRDVYLHDAAIHGAANVPSLQVTLVALPSRLIVTEMVREAWTIVLLGATAWLAGRRPADRAGAFLLAFGVWDVTYYGVLKLLQNWPDSWSAWDILFLIPLPWVAPVWAPVAVACLFIVAGTHLFWTTERRRRYRFADVAALGFSALLTVETFLVRSDAAIRHSVPEHFPSGLFWFSVLLGAYAFFHAEGIFRGAQRKGPRAT